MPGCRDQLAAIKAECLSPDVGDVSGALQYVASQEGRRPRDEAFWRAIGSQHGDAVGQLGPEFRPRPAGSPRLGVRGVDSLNHLKSVGLLRLVSARRKRCGHSEFGPVEPVGLADR